MSELEDEVKVLREKNNELVQKTQYWKRTAAQRENEKLELMKEINQLRLKLSRMRSGGAAQARKLDAALQATTEEALSHLVQASSAVARTIELTKQYIQERQEAEAVYPQWSTLSAASPERVNKVPPLMLGGHSIQPVVQLRRTSLNTARNNLRSPDQARNVTERAVPMHMLQDVYIPLTRIDTSNYLLNYMETEASNDVNNSTDDLGLPEESNESIIEESNNSSDVEEYNISRRLDTVIEDEEPESDESSPQRARIDNPLEGPSWLLDAPNVNLRRAAATRATLEPDSTTELNDHRSPTTEWTSDNKMAFTPTVRRHKRTVSPSSPASGDTSKLNDSVFVGERVLKVLVSKLSMAPPSPSPCRPPPAAPSPHGSTDRSLLVLESPECGGGDASPSSARIISTARPSRGDHDSTRARVVKREVHSEVNSDTSELVSGDVSGDVSRDVSRDVSVAAGDAAAARSRDGDSDSDVSDRAAAELRTRRKRKPVVYTEKPLNRKLRR